jgi:hypothetical protein
MGVMTGVAGALDGSTGKETPLWIAIPPGYFPLPLGDVAPSLERAQAVLTEIADDEQKPQIEAVIGVLSVFLVDLTVSGALYCGVGRHVSPDDNAVITSSLVVSYQEYEGTRNPRLLLSDLLWAKDDAGEHGQADLVDVLNRPMLFFERVRQFPTPELPGQPPVPEGATTPVHQLEAFVPSEDGSKLTKIDFSTPFTAYGADFRTMVVQLAASVSFEPPAVSAESSSRISRLLG